MRSNRRSNYLLLCTGIFLSCILEWWRAFFAYPYSDFQPQRMRELQAAREPARADKGDSYPAWILEKRGVEVMLANFLRG